MAQFKEAAPNLDTFEEQLNVGTADSSSVDQVIPYQIIQKKYLSTIETQEKEVSENFGMLLVFA